MAHLRDRATLYFPELAGAGVAVRRRHMVERAASRLFVFELCGAGLHRPVLVKLPRLREAGGATSPAAGPPGTRPRLVDPVPTGEKFRLEHAALGALRVHFEALGDPRFRTIRVLDLLPEHRALVMELSPGESLRRAMHRVHALRRAGRAAELEVVFHTSGAWLRAYQAIRPSWPVTTRHLQRAEFVSSIEQLAAYLTRETWAGAELDRIVTVLQECSSRALPERLPGGLAHGDFAPRNVLVESGGGITVIDTLSRWIAPVYEDAGYFLGALHVNAARALSLGIALPASRARRYERAFLSGYFGDDPAPLAAVRLFEIRALLDLWAANVERTHACRGLARRGAGVVTYTLIERLVRHRLRETLRRLSP